MSIVLLGATSGSVTLQEPAVAGTTVIDLPATSGTMAVTSGSPSFTNITATGTLAVNGNTTLGDATTDTLTVGVTGIVKDASGNVGIGHATPSSKLSVGTASYAQATSVAQVNGASQPTANAAGIFNIGSTDAAAADVGGSLGFTANGGLNGYPSGQISCRRESATSSVYSTYLAFTTSNSGGTLSEKMRIDSAGNVRIGSTNTSLWVGSEKLTVLGFSLFKQSGTPALVWNTNASGELIAFSAANRTDTGNISTNGTTTSYNVTSDYRLKENVAPMQNALATVALLKPCTYKWKSNGSSSQGFIAHELQEVVPDCVNGEKDAIEIYTDKDGNEQTRPKYQGIDTSFLVATLTAAIQEQQALITQLQADVAALKGA